MPGAEQQGREEEWEREDAWLLLEEHDQQILCQRRASPHLVGGAYVWLKPEQNPGATPVAFLCGREGDCWLL